MGPLRRSVSQLMDGKTVAGDDEAWDPDISGHDSGMVRYGKNKHRASSHRTLTHLEEIIPALIWINNAI